MLTIEYIRDLCENYFLIYVNYVKNQSSFWWQYFKYHTQQCWCDFFIIPFFSRFVSFSTTEGPDYRFPIISTNNLPAEWRLDVEDDDTALEYDDKLNLVYSPRPSNVIDRFEAENQFVRYNASVHIDDNDSKSNVQTLMFFISTT